MPSVQRQRGLARKVDHWHRVRFILRKTDDSSQPCFFFRASRLSLSLVSYYVYWPTMLLPTPAKAPRSSHPDFSGFFLS